MACSRISGFHKLSRNERVRVVRAFANAEINALTREDSLSLATAESMIENVIGVYGLPLGIATNFTINHRDFLIPLVVEEPSVVAALSYGARMVRQGGGFRAEADPPEMIGQIQVLDVADPEAAQGRLLDAKRALLARADTVCGSMVRRGGGARDLTVRVVPESHVGPMLIVNLIIDTRDAMGANTINTALEALAPAAAEIAQGRVGLRILSNLADRRRARAWSTVPKAVLAIEGCSPEAGVQRILEAQALADVDAHRAATHNKGIMNGIDAVAIATGNDWRAIEAGAHAYAARNGHYAPLSRWERDANGDLHGEIEMPMAVGIVGGATRVHPAARQAIRLLGVKSAQELAGIMASVGLAQNLAALRALAMEGIQRGHMRLHARQLALAAGAKEDQVARVVELLLTENNPTASRAHAIVASLGESEA